MDYLLDVHTHTIASGHAYNTIMEMAKAGFDKGLKLLGITEHAPSRREAPQTIHTLWATAMIIAMMAATVMFTTIMRRRE